METIDIVVKKRDGLELTADEIHFFIDVIAAGRLPDYVISAFLMAVRIRGMTEAETLALTSAMLDSGDHIAKFLDAKTIDKHSTGGVGDKVSLIFGPMMTALGHPVVKMSGRGLGITGGTLDKLESIPGFRVDLSMEDIEKSAKQYGFVICAQTKNLAPVDKVLYALRDVTGTIDSVPLIASSIMSKKLCIENDAILIDLKVGSGAFMRDLSQAEELARTICDIARAYQRSCGVLLSDMSTPLGKMVGNILEVYEAVEFLKGRSTEDLKVLVYCLLKKGLFLLEGDGFHHRLDERIGEVISSGKALDIFTSMVRAQGGDLNACMTRAEQIIANPSVRISADSDGFVSRLDAEKIGKISLLLGAGRLVAGAALDMYAGVMICAQEGSRVRKGDSILCLYASQEIPPSIVHEAKAAFDIVSECPPQKKEYLGWESVICNG